LKVRFLRPARQEFDEAALHYESVRAGLGREFQRAVRETVALAKAFPFAWHPLDEELRRSRVRRFPYAVIFAADSDALTIVAIAHLRREPGYWRNRER
jgi:hypothetical protein